MIIFRKSAEGILPDLSAKEIKNGDILSLKVIKRIEGAWQVSLGGKLHTADIKNITVHPGQQLTARAYFDGRTLILKVLTEDMGESSSKSGLSSANFSMEVVQKSIFDLTQALGWSMEVGEVEQLVSLLYQCKREDQGFIRLLLILLDKGLPLSNSIIYPIEQELEGRSGNRGKEKEKKKEREFSQEGEDNIGEETGKSLKKVKGNPLVLVNHLQGIRDNWIFLPLSIKKRNSEKEALLKIQTIGKKASGKEEKRNESLQRSIKRIVLTIRQNQKSWGFIVKNFNETHRTLTIYAEGEKKDKKIVNAIGNLEKYMRKLHVEVDTNIKNWEDFNGFEEKIEKSTIKIDTFA